jgi:hypothetical protein
VFVLAGAAHEDTKTAEDARSGETASGMSTSLPASPDATARAIAAFVDPRPPKR